MSSSPQDEQHVDGTGQYGSPENNPAKSSGSLMEDSTGPPLTLEPETAAHNVLDTHHAMPLPDKGIDHSMRGFDIGVSYNYVYVSESKSHLCSFLALQVYKLTLRI